MQCAFVELAAHGLTAGVADKFLGAFGVADFKILTLGRADADGVDFDAFFGDLARGVDRLLFLVFAISEQDDDFEVIVLRKGFGGFAYGSTDVTATTRNTGLANGIQIFAEG